jgi:hypothetical protein
MRREPIVPPALRRVLEQRTLVPRTDDAEAHSEAMFRAHVLTKVAGLLSGAALDALLVKGAALALTVYEQPAARRMSDIDLLVRPAQTQRVVAALVAGGCEVRPDPARPHSATLLGEVGVFVRGGAMSALVEVHSTLDKVVTRPIDIAALFTRAAPAPNLPGLFVPSPEDHALLVALHASTHDFVHPVAFLDLELLLRRGLDRERLVTRAREWRLTSVMFAMLSAMRQLGAASVDDALVAAFDPGAVRRALLGDAATRGVSRPGLGWIVAQTKLRDDPAAWAIGVGRYAVARARDRGARTTATRDASEPAAKSYRAPLWARALLASDRLAARLENVRASVRDEALLAWIAPAQRTALTASVYADLPTYLPGGARYRSGLFSWEKRLLEMPQVPRAGRVLLGACGPGRELVELVARGFAVVAFDPCEPFVEAARGAIPPGHDAQVVLASYDAVVDAAAGRGGALATACAGKRFDLVVLGWGSLSHVMPSSARAALLGALRALAPEAPVLASFGLVTEIAPWGHGKGRLRDALRRLFAAAGAPGVSEDHDHFLPTTGFLAYLDRGELQRLARESGYEIAEMDEAPYPHALLTPV